MNRRTHYFLPLLILSMFVGFCSNIRSASPAKKPSWGTRAFSTKNRFVGTSALLAVTPVVLALREAIASARTTTPAEKKKADYLKKLALAALKNAQSRELWQRHFATACAVTTCFPAREAKETRKAWAIRVKNLLKIYAKTNPALAAVWSLWFANIVGTTIHQGYKGACATTSALKTWVASLQPEDYDTPVDSPAAAVKEPQAPPIVPPVTHDDEEEVEVEVEVDARVTADTARQEAHARLLEDNSTLLRTLKRDTDVQALPPQQVHIALELLEQPGIEKPANHVELKRLLEQQRTQLEKRGNDVVKRLVQTHFFRKQLKKRHSIPPVAPHAARAQPIGAPRREAVGGAPELVITPYTEKLQAWVDTPENRAMLRQRLKAMLGPVHQHRGKIHGLLAWNYGVNPFSLHTWLSIPAHLLTSINPDDDASLDNVINIMTGVAQVPLATGETIKWIAMDAIPVVYTGLREEAKKVTRWTRNTALPALQTGATVTKDGVVWVFNAAVPTVAVGTKDLVVAGGQLTGQAAVATGRFTKRQTIACGGRSKRGANRAWAAIRRHVTADNAKKAAVATASGTAQAGWWGTKKLAAGSWWLLKKNADFVATNLGLKAAARKTAEAATATHAYVAPAAQSVGSALSRFAAFMLSGKNRKKLKTS